METATIKGHEIPLDEQNRACLTEIWRMAGRPAYKKPSHFKRRKATREILGCAQWLTIRGHQAGTWAHYHLVRMYAEYVGLEEAKPQPSFIDSLWDEVNRKLDEMKQAREQAAQERESSSEPDPDHDQDGVFRGESWKGEYDPDTAGEEWKQGTNLDPFHPTNRIIKYAHYHAINTPMNNLFIDFIELGDDEGDQGKLIIHLSVN